MLVTRRRMAEGKEEGEGEREWSRDGILFSLLLVSMAS